MLRRAALLLTIASLAFVVGSAAPAFASGGSGSGGGESSASPPCGSFNMVVGGLAIGLVPQPITVLVKGKITNCSTAREGMSLRIDDVTSLADSCEMTSFGWAPGTMSSYGLMSSSNYKAQNIFVARPDCLGRACDEDPCRILNARAYRRSPVANASDAVNRMPSPQIKSPRRGTTVGSQRTRIVT